MVEPSTPMRTLTVIVALALGTLHSTHVAAQSQPLGRSLATLVSEAEARHPLPGATVAYRFVDANTGRVLAESGADTPLNPASNTKLLTAAAALSLLGPSYRFETTVHGLRSPADPSAIAGDLVLYSNGDPDLRTGHLFELARALSNDGIRRVDGALVLDESAFGDEHLPPAFEQQPDEQAPFRAAVGSLSIDENTSVVHIFAPTAGAPLSVLAEPRGYIELVSTATAAAPGTASTLATLFAPLPDGREQLRLSGAVAASPTPVLLRRRLANPAQAVGAVWRATLEAAGITVSGPVTVVSSASARPMPPLAAHRSAPLSSLLLAVGKESNNFTAEMTLLALAGDAPPATAAATRSRFARASERVLGWARGRGVDTRAMVYRNGSGLFDANRFSATQVTALLRSMWRDTSLRHEYLAQLAANGDEGTLRHRLGAPTPVRLVRAKTGTLDDVVALSGYLLTADPNRAVIFSYLANGVRGQTTAARQRIDALVGSWMARRLQ